MLCLSNRTDQEMKVDEIRAILDKWQERMLESDTRLDALMNMMMASPESDFFSAQHAMMGAYTEAVARIVQDDCDWLSWWWLDCAFGASGSRECKPWGSAEWRRIENTTDLAQLLFDCAEHGQT